MALIRQVKVHENSRAWAFIEFSDEHPERITILGNREFPTKEEAVEYSKGFEVGSYEYVEPEQSRRMRLVLERTKLHDRIQEINRQLK